MTVKEFFTEKQLDDEFERLEELSFEHLSLKEVVKEAEQALEEAKRELQNFEEDYQEIVKLT